MKIGILTYHRPCNFGANLQAYASSQYLMSLGHEVKVIDFVRDKDLSYSGIIPEKQFKAHRKFVETRLSLTEMARTEKDLQEITKKERFDLILVGADAVWSATDNYRIFFCKWLFDCPDLVKHTKVASMSPADMGGGYAKFSDDVKKEIRQCLENFSFVTVRDQWTMDAINKGIFSGKDFVKVVNPDPVSLIDSLVRNEQWNSNGLIPEKYVLMTLTTDWIKARRLKAKRIAWFNAFKKKINTAGFQLVELPLPDGPSGLEFDQTLQLPFDCIQWYLTIKNAKAYCGVRFHAIVSCIASGVPFYSLDTYCHRPRWVMLLDMVGLHSCSRSFDKKSKIHNLLLGTRFESNRTGNLEFESPNKVAKLILQCPRENIQDLSGRNKSIFTENLKEMLHE